MQNEQEELDPIMLRLAVEGSQLGIWDFDVLSGTLKWSKQLHKMLGVPEHTQPSMELLQDLIHPDDREMVALRLEEHLSSKEPYAVEYRIIQQGTDDVLWCHFTGSAIYDDAGEPIRMVGTGYDITRIKEAEIRAESADLAKSQFLANMSHEIRTPMNGVMGMASLLAATDLNIKQQGFADIIMQSGESLLRIINDILDFTKIDAKQLTLRLEPFNLADAIEDVAILMSGTAAGKNIELAVRLEQGLPSMLVGDAGRLRQILGNLLSNAIKFTKEGHVLVDVSGKTSVRDGETVLDLEMRIEDTGVGIPLDKQPTIFDKFTQVDNSASRMHEGTGLGLSICKSLIEIMDGDITLESTPGRGSTFAIAATFPVHTEEPAQDAVPVDISGAQILIVDDNQVNREILMEQCAAWGFKSISCNSGPLGLKYLKAADKLGAPFDTVILDYHMPAMTGMEVAQIIRSDKKLRDTGLILLSSVDDTQLANQIAKLHIDDQLVKPAKSTHLLRGIVKSVQRYRSQKLPSASKHTQAIENAAKFTYSSSPEREVSFSRTEKPGDHIDVLIAEDNEVNKIVIEQIMKLGGFSFKIVSNGAEAVEAFKTCNARCILMDISMPVMNGLDATAAIRALEVDTGQHIPIIGVTAHAMSGDMEKCLDGGMDDYLPKPISPKRCGEKIRSWLETGQGKRLSA